jgi:DNA topoisomerase VI subunit B
MCADIHQNKLAIEQLVERAIKKVGAKKANDICRYIPGPKGGYIHHFSLKKICNEDPKQFVELVNKFILDCDHPKKQPPKPRAPRGSRKRKEPLSLSQQDLELLLTLARKSGAKDIVQKLTPRKNFRSIKRELIASIREDRIEEGLWRSYSDVIMSQSATAH